MSFIRNKSVNKRPLSKNPYKQMNDSEDHNQQNENEEGSPSSPASPFMSFSPKPNVDVSRRYTQKRQPPTMAEFMTEFEQERRPSFTVKSPSVSSNHSIISDAEEDSMASYEDIEEFSDTARLTINASDMNGFDGNQGSSSNRDQNRLSVTMETSDDLDSQQIFNTNVNSSRISFQQGRPISRVYEPALINPEVDQRNRKLNKILHFDKRACARNISRAIRRLSKRIVNVHNNYNPDDLTAQPQQSHLPHQNQQQSPLADQEHHGLMNKRARHNEDGGESDTSSVINETIPMTRTSSNNINPSNKPILNTTASSASHGSSINQKDTKHNIQLAGNSLRLLSPTNPFRLFFARIMYYKYVYMD